MRMGPLAFGELLKRLRLAAGLTQDDLARSAGLSPRGVSDLERGLRTTPRPSTARLLADALDLAGSTRAGFLLAARGEATEHVDDAINARAHDPARAAAQEMAIPGEAPSGIKPASHPHNLPLAMYPLLGRASEVAAVGALLLRSDVRLVTLTGPGGIGKTRLSREVAATVLDHFCDGVWQVRLSRLTDPALVLPAVAQVFGMKEGGAVPLIEALCDFLRGKCLLLVLDNFEQVAAAAPHLIDLLAACPEIKMLVTSRVALHLRGEQEFALRPLALPTPGLPLSVEQLPSYAAVALFVERAQAARADFIVTPAVLSTIAEICARLDGLPLAIELAAARVRFLPPRALLTRLDRQLALLTGGARDLDERQRTMRDTITWSYDLLQPEEQRLFRRLAVFAGGCTLEAAEAVCAAPEGAEPLGMELLEALEVLVDQSLVVRIDDQDEPHYAMLHVLREFALEALEASGEAEAIRRAHLAYFLHLTEPINWRGVRGPQGTFWLARLEREHDNLRTALAWARDTGEFADGLRLGVALGGFWLERGYQREGRTWLESFLASLEQSGRAENMGADAGMARVWARGFVAAFAANQGDLAYAVSLLEGVLAAGPDLADPSIPVLGLQMLGRDLVFLGEHARGVVFLDESLARARAVTGDPDTLLNTLVLVADSLCMVPGAEARAAVLAREAIALAQREGRPYYETFARCVLASEALRRGDPAQAEMQATRALRLARNLGLKDMALSGLEYLGLVAGCTGQGERAARLLGVVEAQRRRFGYAVLPAWRVTMDTLVAPARLSVGEVAWAAAAVAGRALSVEQAIAEALGEGASAAVGEAVSGTLHG